MKCPNWCAALSCCLLISVCASSACTSMSTVHSWRACVHDAVHVFCVYWVCFAACIVHVQCTLAV